MWPIWSWNPSLDRELEENKKKNQKKPSVEDEMDEELEREKHIPLNMRKSIYDSGALGATGINNAPSVFEKSALFRIRPED